jgi:hypothetical protein
MNVPFKLLSYINGILFYPAGVSYSSTEGEHATFTLTMPAVPHWAILPVRSHCAVFYTDPVSNSWRLLCEGEYIGDVRQRSASGTRYRALAFRSMHALWETTTYAGMCGLAGGDISQSSRVIASGGVAETVANSSLDLYRQNLDAIMRQYVSAGVVISSFIPNFLAGAMQQTPVDAFYNEARQLNHKQFALPDQEIGKVINVELINRLMRESWNSQSLGPNTSLETIVRSIENLSMYKHVTIPAPPIYRTVDQATRIDQYVIGELLFLPHLYCSVPPACNVIFKDQITNLSGQRNYMSEPTRVVVQLSDKLTAQNLPLFVMSNDAERAVSIGTLRNVKGAAENQTNEGAAPGTLTIHDFLTREEYDRGVTPQFISLPIQSLVTREDEKVKAASDPVKETNKIIDYTSHSARHYYEVARGAQRRVTVNATFLPYLVPGFPCLVEDDDGSFWGMIASISHSLVPSMQPSTTVEVTHVRDAYIVDGTLRNTYNPLWLNKAFLPNAINKTYDDLFGANAPDAVKAGDSLTPHAAMVPASIITSVGTTQTSISLNAADQVNLDELAAYVIPIQRYTHDGRFVALDTSNTVASKIRRTDDVQLNCLKFQYRPGTTLTQFAKFHKLAGVRDGADSTVSGLTSANDVDYIFSSSPPPTDLAMGTPHLLFGSPVKMKFTGKESLLAGSPYGVYTLESDGNSQVTYIRQQAALTIRDAINQVITKD